MARPHNDPTMPCVIAASRDGRADGDAAPTRRKRSLRVAATRDRLRLAHARAR
ncbi:hypothetical protein [Sphingomonas sp. BK235]|jgi:hypothetical protein|uniref:hypothetical protein n=1 Tax=Sphingomonas sp. BK235 TaxID=2512131 RepID=UPI0010F0DED6|nr:hypothetical protein [Sphingomonas sp. BK235]TCP35501.1 hypothetical protein EV292_10285 [Sphingomonas sp. BK235]